jgi:hypothetical protein
MLVLRFHSKFMLNLFIFDLLHCLLFGLLLTKRYLYQLCLYLWLLHVPLRN